MGYPFSFLPFPLFSHTTRYFHYFLLYHLRLGTPTSNKPPSHPKPFPTLECFPLVSHVQGPPWQWDWGEGGADSAIQAGCPEADGGVLRPATRTWFQEGLAWPVDHCWGECNFFFCSCCFCSSSSSSSFFSPSPSLPPPSPPPPFFFFFGVRLGLQKRHSDLG